MRRGHRRIGQFSTDPTEAARQLSMLEGDLTDSLDSLEAKKADRFSVSMSTVGVDIMTIVDSSTGNVAIQLPLATPQNAGRPVVINRVSASSSIVVSAPNQAVNGATTDTLPASIAVYFYYSTGAAWYRQY